MPIEYTEAITPIKCWTCDNDTTQCTVLTSALKHPVCSECLAILVTQVLDTGLSVTDREKNKDMLEFRELCAHFLQALRSTQVTLKKKIEEASQTEVPEGSQSSD